MDLAQKVGVATKAIDSISRHDDEDAAVRKAMLAQVSAHIAAEITEIDERIAARLAQLAGEG